MTRFRPYLKLKPSVNRQRDRLTHAIFAYLKLSSTMNDILVKLQCVNKLETEKAKLSPITIMPASIASHILVGNDLSTTKASINSMLKNLGELTNMIMKDNG